MIIIIVNFTGILGMTLIMIILNRILLTMVLGLILGIKYHRITGKTENKDLYDVRWAMDSAEKQAGHFFDSREEQISKLASFMQTPPIVVCPYDAELFGHWWYEGPYWLYVLFKKIYYDKCDFKLITPGEFIDKYPEMQQCTPCRSSWGANRL